MKSCGPGASQEVLSLRKSVTSCEGDGGKQEPAHRGEREVSVKTIAQGKPGVPSVSASACARTFFLRARLWVQWAPGFLCTLFLKGAAFLALLGRNLPRECGRLSARAV